MLKTLAVFLCSVWFFTACQKEKFTDSPEAMLSFSTDTLHFDTVFVTVGSATRNFKVRNLNKESVRISSIKLAGGQSSYFRVNVDGFPATELTNYELAGGDSMYVFVEVTIDPNNQANPFIITDSIVFVTNGNVQDVKLAAYGQNAHFFFNEVLECNTVWRNDLPYVIKNSVLVAPGCSLTIEKGVKIYSHSRSGILVAGTMVVNGTADEPVEFRGDRLEHIYEKEPGQWYGIQFLPKSEGNIIRHAIIRNGVIGIEADSLPLTNGVQNLFIEKSIISHMSSVGLIGYTSHITGRNLLIHSCGLYLMVGNLGGSYDFQHCTFENGVAIFAQKYPGVVLTNTDYKVGSTVIANNLYARFHNNIIWGSTEDELNVIKDGTGGMDTVFIGNIIKSKNVQKFGRNNFLNENPGFADAFKSDYKLKEDAFARDRGNILNPPVTTDLENKPRNDGKPDLGCYELHP